MRFFWQETIAVIVVSLLLCLSPWTGQFSYEYSFFLTVALFPILTVSTWIRFQNQTWNLQTKIKILFSYLVVLLIPLSIVLMFSWKYGICSFTSGLIWFVTIPLITTVYCVGCGMWAASYAKQKWITLLLALLPTILFSCLTLRDLYIDPSLKFYHPVLAYFPGPVYDEWIPKFLSLYTFRAWIMVLSFWFLIRGSIPSKQWLGGVVLLFPIFMRMPLEWHHTHHQIQDKIGISFETKYANIYFPKTQLHLVGEFATFVDTTISDISKRLNINYPEEKIRIYIYPDATLKKKWTGTQYTLVGNPMQRSLHLLSMSQDPITIHELTHVISAPMGIPLFKISPRIALMEGLATAMQEQEMNLPIDEWARTMQAQNMLPDIDRSLGAFSFWKQNPTRVYLASGSFVKWLLENFEVEKFKKVYRGISFNSAYGRSTAQLVEEWKNDIQKIPVTDETIQKTKKYLEAKPFYQKKCVHEVADLLMNYSTCKQNECKIYLFKACDLDKENVRLQEKCALQRN
jgi:hypothetical protein